MPSKKLLGSVPDCVFQITTETNYGKCAGYLVGLELLTPNRTKSMEIVRLATDNILCVNFDRMCAILVEYVHIMSQYKINNVYDLGHFTRQFGQKIRFTESILMKLENVSRNVKYMQLIRNNY